MKRSGKSKTGRKSGAASPDPAQAIDRAAPDIVEALITQAKQGSYQHARFLFEFAGIAAPARPQAEGEESLAALLFRELQLEEP